jgi:hypothetical protein
MQNDKSRRIFVLLDADDLPTSTVFRSASPRSAALKAASRGCEDISLFDAMTKCIWRFRGWKEKIRGFVDVPHWLLQAEHPSHPKVQARSKDLLDGPKFNRIVDAMDSQQN